MTRYILCEACGSKWKEHPEDKARGIVARKVIGRAHCPPDQHITVHDVTKGTLLADEEQTELHCDFCNSLIDTWKSGTHAVTFWDTNRELEPDLWEKNYFVSFKRIQG